MKTAKSPNPNVPTVLISSAVVLAIGAGVYALSQKPTTQTTPAPTTTTNNLDTNSDNNVEPATQTTPVSTTTDNPNNQAVATNTSYQDGSYTAIGSYLSPGGPETIGITLKITNDVITAASAEIHATLPASVNWQTAFATGLSAAVVGKSLDEVKLDKVSGSSLTPVGFHDALTKIQAEAKS